MGGAEPQADGDDEEEEDDDDVDDDDDDDDDNIDDDADDDEVADESAPTPSSKPRAAKGCVSFLELDMAVSLGAASSAASASAAGFVGVGSPCPHRLARRRLQLSRP